MTDRQDTATGLTAERLKEWVVDDELAWDVGWDISRQAVKYYNEVTPRKVLALIDAHEEALTALEAKTAEVEDARKYRTLPPGYVWQDYYSPDEVIAIRREVEFAIKTAERERDEARAEVEHLVSDLAVARGNHSTTKIALDNARAEAESWEKAWRSSNEERNAYRDDSVRYRLDRGRQESRADRAEAALERVKVLHRKEPARYYESDLNPNRRYDCLGCGEGRAWPCPTIRAIEGADDV